MAAELVVFALAKTTQTPSPSQDCQPVADLGIPENTQAPLAKIDIRCENYPEVFYKLISFPAFAGGTIRRFSATVCKELR